MSVERYRVGVGVPLHGVALPAARLLHSVLEQAPPVSLADGGRFEPKIGQLSPLTLPNQYVETERLPRPPLR